jgi:hypothetical protein
MLLPRGLVLSSWGELAAVAAGVAAAVDDSIVAAASDAPVEAKESIPSESILSFLQRSSFESVTSRANVEVRVETSLPPRFLLESSRAACKRVHSDGQADPWRGKGDAPLAPVLAPVITAL